MTDHGTRLSKALSDLDAPSIINQLCRYEHERQNSIDRTSELLLASQEEWIRLQDWELAYLNQVGETFDQAAVYFWSIDLAWRRYILDRETLAPSLDLDRIRSLIDTFLTAPIEPYSVEDYSLGQGLDHVTQFGLMYGKIADGWRKHGRPRGWIDQVGPAIDTGRLVNLTKAYAVGVSKLAVRVRALYDKYISDDFSEELAPNSSAPSRPPHSSQDGLLTPCASSDGPKHLPDDSGPSTSSRPPRHAGESSVTMDESSNGRAKGQTSTKHPREDFDDGELDRETFVIRDEAAIDVVAGQGLEEEQISPGRQGAKLETTQSSERPQVGTARAGRPPSPEAGAQAASRDGRLSAEQDTAMTTVSLEASQFPQPLSKPTYLSRVSRSPSARSARERSDSPFLGTARRGLPAGIRSMAVQTQTKLAKARRSSEMHLQQERVKAESVERALSDERLPQSEAHPAGSSAAATDDQTEMERIRGEELATQAEVPEGRPLGATPSGVLMPPPTTKATGNSPIRKPGSPPSSAEEPSTLPEPSTILSSPPPPEVVEPVRASSAQGDLVVPSSSNEEGAPTSQKSSQDLGFPTAAQPGSPHVSLAQRLPPKSSATAPAHTTYASDRESRDQDESQSQHTDSEPPSQTKPREPSIALSATEPSHTSSVSSSAESNPKILVPDTSVSTLGASSEPPIPAPDSPRLNSLAPPGRARSTSREPSVDLKPPPSPLRRSSRLSKSPAPQAMLPTPSRKKKRRSAEPALELPLVTSIEALDSQAFLTQAPLGDTQEFATQAEHLPASAEEEEEQPRSQESPGLAHLSMHERGKEDKAPVTTSVTKSSGRHTRFHDVEGNDSATTSAGKPSRTSLDSLTDLPAIVDEDFESFGPQDTEGDKLGRARKMSFGELENQASGPPPAEESLDLEDDI